MTSAAERDDGSSSVSEQSRTRPEKNLYRFAALSLMNNQRKESLTGAHKARHPIPAR